MNKVLSKKKKNKKMIIKFINTNFKFVKILKILSKIVNISKKKWNIDLS